MKESSGEQRDDGPPEGFYPPDVLQDWERKEYLMANAMRHPVRMWKHLKDGSDPRG